MGPRGWTLNDVIETLNSPEKYQAMDYRTTPYQPATRYVNPSTGKFIVVNDETGELVQVSGEDFVPKDFPIDPPEIDIVP
jgi:hypothetical protein